MHRQYLHLDSRTLAYFDSAPGQRLRTLVLLHAFPLSAGMWERQLEAVPAGWRLIAPDLRGFGGSTILPVEEEPLIDDYAADVLDLLRELGIDSAVIGGCSMGGYAVFALLRRAPEVADAVILIDTRAGADTPEGRANRRNMLALLDREGTLGVCREIVPKLLGRTTLSERPEVELFVRRLVKQQPPDALRGAIRRMMTRPDSTDLLPTIAVPALVLVGEEDTLTPVAESERMASLLSHAELRVLPRTGHLPSIEDPPLFNDALMGFLSRL
jgi:pimeloyl-ACP methyl ester carboxylesterase